jgi:translation initiation factor 4B
MSFESTADDVKDFFSQSAGLTPLSVRTVSGYDGKPKGFCYAEFAEPDMLKAALDLSGSDLGGRAVRIGVAEPRE